MKIVKCGESIKEAVDLTSIKTVNDFCKLWEKQGNTVIGYDKELGVLNLKNQEGKKLFCIVLGELIFPFE